jgi:uncharacterized protein (TIGR03083 family)
MEVTALIGQLEQHGSAMAAAIGRAGLDAAVPTCPDWDVRALVEHTGMVHRWATGIVRDEPDASRNSDYPAPETGLLDWFVAGYTNLAAALKAAPADLEVWAFLPAPSPLAFWARRQAHETAIHRADAESAFGWVPSYDAEFAADGIAELLEGFNARRTAPLVADPGFRLRVLPIDVNASWVIDVRPDGRSVTRDASGEVDCTLTGTSDELYLELWNRGGGSVAVTGDGRPMEIWRQLARVTWT